MKQKQNMYVPLLDIPASYEEILAEVEKNISQIIRSGRFILGPMVEELEQQIAIYCGTKYEVGCFSLSITKPINMIYGGFCATNSKKIYNKLIAIRNNGVNAEPENARLELASELGLNLKPSDLHASIGLINLNSRNTRMKNLKNALKEQERSTKLPKKVQMCGY